MQSPCFKLDQESQQKNQCLESKLAELELQLREDSDKKTCLAA